jgi:hypothetical protein
VPNNLSEQKFKLNGQYFSLSLSVRYRRKHFRELQVNSVLAELLKKANNPDSTDSNNFVNGKATSKAGDAYNKAKADAYNNKAGADVYVNKAEAAAEAVLADSGIKSCVNKSSSPFEAVRFPPRQGGDPIIAGHRGDSRSTSSEIKNFADFEQ